MPSACKNRSSPSNPSKAKSRYASAASWVGNVVWVACIEMITPDFSINSMAQGLNFDNKTAFTALAQSSRFSNEATNNNSWVGLGMSLSTALVITPSIPSLPIIKCVKENPVEFFNVLAPVQMISPVGNTTSRLST